jgi:hypothetical protein
LALPLAFLMAGKKILPNGTFGSILASEKNTQTNAQARFLTRICPLGEILSLGRKFAPWAKVCPLGESFYRGGSLSRGRNFFPGKKLVPRDVVCP